MNKSEEKKLRKHIVDLVGDNYTDSDELLIIELIDWLRISQKAKEELQKSVVDNEEMSWKALGTLSMCNRIILSTFKSLDISPYEKIKE